MQGTKSYLNWVFLKRYREAHGNSGQKIHRPRSLKTEYLHYFQGGSGVLHSTSSWVFLKGLLWYNWPFYLFYLLTNMGPNSTFLFEEYYLVPSPCFSPGPGTSELKMAAISVKLLPRFNQLLLFTSYGDWFNSHNNSVVRLSTIIIPHFIEKRTEARRVCALNQQTLLIDAVCPSEEIRSLVSDLPLCEWLGGNHLISLGIQLVHKQFKTYIFNLFIKKLKGGVETQ